MIEYFVPNMVAGDDPDHGRAQVPGTGEGGGGGRQPHVDRVGLPAAPADHLRLRRGRHAGAAGQDRQVLQGESAPARFPLTVLLLYRRGWLCVVRMHEIHSGPLGINTERQL